MISEIDPCYVVGVIYEYRGKKVYRFYHSFDRDESYNGYSIKPQLHEFFVDPIEANRYNSKETAKVVLNTFVTKMFNRTEDRFPKKVDINQFKVYKLSFNLLEI